MQKIIFIVLFVLLFFSCASTRNNGIGTGDAGNVYIESAITSGKIESGISNIAQSTEALRREIAGSQNAVDESINAQRTAIEYNTFTQSRIEESIRLNHKISDILQHIRERNNYSEIEDKSEK